MTQKSSKIPNFDEVYKNENNTWFSSVLPCMYWQIIHGLYHILIVVYGRQATIHDSKYGTTRVLFSKYIHGKTDENVLFSKSF